MRKRPIDTLFSPIQQDILAAAYDNPSRWWYLTELAAHANRTPSSLQRELKSFEEGGILESRRDGGRVYFRANAASPLFEPLRQIVERSLGIESEVARAIAPLVDRIETLFIYGSVARGDEGAGSDVDLFCVGRAGLAEITKVLRPLEKRFRREFDASCYTPDEFSEKLASGNHFLNALRAETKVFIVGSDDVFGRRRLKRESLKGTD